MQSILLADLSEEAINTIVEMAKNAKHIAHFTINGITNFLSMYMCIYNFTTEKDKKIKSLK